MGYSCRCPFCDKVIAVMADDRATFRAFILIHIGKCPRTPPNVTYGAAVEIAESMVTEAIGD